VAPNPLAPHVRKLGPTAKYSREARDSHRSLERDVPFQREIDTLAKSRKSLYPFRKLTIFNGVLNFEARLVGDSDLGSPVTSGQEYPRSATKLSASVAAAEAMAEAVVRVEVLGALSQVVILLV
jgi:hypothetical protein